MTSESAPPAWRTKEWWSDPAHLLVIFWGLTTAAMVGVAALDLASPLVTIIGNGIATFLLFAAGLRFKKREHEAKVKELKREVTSEKGRRTRDRNRLAKESEQSYQRGLEGRSSEIRPHIFYAVTDCLHGALALRAARDVTADLDSRAATESTGSAVSLYDTTRGHSLVEYNVDKSVQHIERVVAALEKIDHAAVADAAAEFKTTNLGDSGDK